MATMDHRGIGSNSTNTWLVFGISLIPWILTHLHIYIEMVQRDNISKITDFNKELNNFYWLQIGGLIFTSMGMTASSIMVNQIKIRMEELSPIFENKSDNKEWFNGFIEDLNRWNWLAYFIVLFIAGTAIHYQVYGYKIIDVFGIMIYIISVTIMFIPNMIVASWVVWLMAAQYFHLYKFSKIDQILHIGDSRKKIQKFSKILPVMILNFPNNTRFTI